MLAVGAFYARRIHSLDSYFAGGKQLPWWLAGVSFLMSYVSALSIVVYAGLGYQFGLTALSIYWTTVPATILITLTLARRWRRTGIITPVEFLETRFSAFLRQVFAWSGVPLKVIDEGLKIVAIGIFVSVGTGLKPAEAMIAVGLITLAYTTMGGLWAVVITDFAQFVLVTTVIVMLLPLSLRAAGGWRRFMAQAPRGFFHPVHWPYGWTYVGAFFVLSTLSLAGNWSLIQKFYSTRSDRECRRVGWLASFLFLILPPLWILSGMAARIFLAPAGIDPQTVYARLSASLLPPGMLGLVVAALFAATMSVLSSGYNVTAAVLTVDVHQRWIHPRASPDELLVVGRVLTCAIGLLALALALAVTDFHWTIFNTMVEAFSFFLPPTVLPMLAGLLSRRLSSRGALAGFAVGILAGAALLGYQAWARPANAASFQEWSIFLPTALTLLTLCGAALWLPAQGAEGEQVARFFLRLEEPAALTSDREVASPAPIVGLVILVMGLVLTLLGSGIVGVHANGLTASTGAFFVAIGIWMRGGRAMRAVSTLFWRRPRGAR